MFWPDGSWLCKSWYILNYERRNWSFSPFIYPGNENIKKNQFCIDDQSAFLAINWLQFWLSIPNTSFHFICGMSSDAWGCLFLIWETKQGVRLLNYLTQLLSVGGCFLGHLWFWLLVFADIVKKMFKMKLLL